MSERERPEVEAKYEQQVDSGGALNSALELAMADRIPWLEAGARANIKTEELAPLSAHPEPPQVSAQ